MNISLTINVKILDQFSLPNNATTDSQKAFMIISFDDYFSCVPTVVDLTSNKFQTKINLTCDILDTPHTRYKLNELISTDLAGTLQKKYNNIAFVTKKIPSDSFLIIKIFTPNCNDSGQVCETIKCGGIVSIDNLTNKKVTNEVLYIHDKSIDTFGYVSIRVDKFELKEGVKFGGKKINLISDQNISNDTSSTIKKHVDIARIYNSKIGLFLEQFDFNRIYKSKYIRCHYNFSTFGDFLPLSFVMVNKYVSNIDFWMNLYKTCLIDVILKFQIVKFKDIADLSLKEIDIKYWSGLPLKLKDMIMIQMFRCIPNSIPYINDFVSYTKSNTKSSENFNPCALFNKSADCEDFASISRMLFNGLRQCDISNAKTWDNSKHTGLYEIWLMTGQYIDSVTLYRVTTAAVSGLMNKTKDGITAHMNLILIPLNVLFKNMTLDKVWNSKDENSENIDAMSIGMAKESKKFHNCVNELSRIRSICKFELIKRLTSLVVEGTGPLCSFVMDPVNRIAKKKVNYIIEKIPALQMEIYHTPRTKRVFFTHAMLGLCDMTRFGVRSDGWVYTQGYDTKGKLLKSSEFDEHTEFSYGCKFTDLASCNNSSSNVNFVVRPFLSSKEIKSSHFTSKLQISSPTFKIFNDDIKGRTIRDKSTVKFAPTSYKNNTKKIKKRVIETKKTVTRMCNSLKESIKYSKNRIFTNNEHNVVMRSRLFDYPLINDKLKDLVISKEYNNNCIIDLNFYFEDLFDGIYNVVLVFVMSY